MFEDFITKAAAELAKQASEKTGLDIQPWSLQLRGWVEFDRSGLVSLWTASLPPYHGGQSGSVEGALDDLRERVEKDQKGSD